MIPSSHLDPINDSPMATGPSVNMTAMTAAEPRWREESFNIQPKRMPISFKLKPSVFTHKHRQPDMGIARVPVMVRSSNQRPVEAGLGPSASQWQMSDPGTMLPSGALPGMGGYASGALPGMGENPTAVGGRLSVGAVLGIGALCGALLFYCTNKR